MVDQVTDHAKEEGAEPDLLLDSEVPVVDLDLDLDPDLDPILYPDPDPDPDYWTGLTPPAQVPNPTSKAGLAGKSLWTCLAKERSAHSASSVHRVAFVQYQDKWIKGV